MLTDCTELNKENLDHMIKNVLNNEEINNYNIDIANKKLIIYGAGDLGAMAIQLLSKVGIFPSYIVDKNPNKKGVLVQNIKVVLPDEINKDDLKNAVFIVCIVKFPYLEFKSYLELIGCKNIIHFYDLTYILKDKISMTNGWRYEKLTCMDKKLIQKVYMNLSDNNSKAYYLMVLYWRILHKEIFFRNLKINIDNKFFPPFIKEILTEKEVFVDCGAYTGNTINKFLVTVKNKFNKIIAYEPNKENFIELKNYVETLDRNLNDKIKLYCCGIGEKNTQVSFLERGISSKFCEENQLLKLPINSLDNIIKDNITFIKMHLEGMELKALQGAINIIKSNRPILAITLYHTEEGCYKIPLYLMENIKNYHYYHQLHMYCGQSSVLYAIPDERIK